MSKLKDIFIELLILIAIYGTLLSPSGAKASAEGEIYKCTDSRNNIVLLTNDKREVAKIRQGKGGFPKDSCQLIDLKKPSPVVPSYKD